MSPHHSRHGPLARAAALALAVSLLAGCNKAVKDPDYAPVAPQPEPVKVVTDGRIYRVGYGQHLFEDNTARRIGDILVVELVENTDASKTSEASVEKDTTVDIESPTLFGSGVQFDLPSWFPLASTMNNTLDFNTSSSSDFEGTGESSQSNSLRGSITVTVVDVQANGNLVVRGEKIMTLNRGPEYVRVSGIVRPQDINAHNRVASTRLADVQITYGGEGEVADASAMGWLARFFISAFFPF